MSTAPAPAPEPPAAARPTLGLMRLFAVAGALAIGLFSLALGLMLGHFIESRMLERDAAVSGDFVQGLARVQQLASVLRAGDPAGAPGQRQFAEFIAHLGAMPGVLRVNVYATDRRVLWSTRPEMIGRQFAVNDELEAALRGEVVVHASAAPDKAEHLLLAGSGGDYVENYLPVVDEGGRRVIAVVELYRRPDALFEAIRSGRRLMAAGAAAGGLFLFVCLIGFVRHAEGRLREQQRRLVDAEALAIVGEISAAVAHSVRNPLGSIRSSAELQRELGGDPDGTQTEIMRNVDRIEVLVRSLLAYAAEAPHGDARADLDQVAAEVARSAGPELGRQGKRFELDLARGLGRVDADAVLIGQILQTLLTNAAEATREGGLVTLRGWRDGPRAVLEVGDDGVGIAPERLHQVFKPFFTTKPRGLGMGLALAQRVVRRLGGELQVHSAPNQGTRVRLTLPARAG